MPTRNPQAKTARLTRADLRNSELVQADLTRADLTGAKLAQANVDGADFRGAIGVDHIQGLDSTRNRDKAILDAK